MKIITCEQRSPEWYAARLGRLTSSCCGDAFARLKRGGWGASREKLIARLVCERLTGKSQDADIDRVRAVERGLQLEAEARMYYEAETGYLIEPVGCIQHDSLMASCSPDGLIDDDGILEIKCPSAATHLEYLREALPDEYFLQIVHQCWIAGRQWGEFVSYHPDFPPALRMKTIRVPMMGAASFESHELNVRVFLSDVDKQVQELETLSVEVELP